MINGSANWFFEIREIPPIVRCYCTTNDKKIIPVMTSMAADLIGIANKFNGIPFRLHTIPDIKSPLMVSFTLIFKTPNDAISYLKELKQLS